MAKKKPVTRDPRLDLQRHALSLPDAESGIACKGTSLEQPTVNVNGKAFLFLGESKIRLKLQASLPDAIELSKAEPEVFSASAGGWVTIAITGESLPLTLLKKLAEESYSLMATKMKR